jgi:hypothetical protein
VFLALLWSAERLFPFKILHPYKIHTIDIISSDKIILCENIQNQPSSRSHRQLAEISEVLRSNIACVTQQEEKQRNEGELRHGQQEILLETPRPLVRKQIILTDRPPLVGEVNVNYCG